MGDVKDVDKTLQFDCESALFDWLYQFQLGTNYALSVKNSASLNNVILKKLPCNPELGYDEIRFSCIREGTIKSKGNNQRKRQSLKCNCRVFIQFRTSLNGKEKLVVTEFHLEHNHPCEEEYFVENHVTKMKSRRDKQKAKRDRCLEDRREMLPADKGLDEKRIENPKTMILSKKTLSRVEEGDSVDVSNCSEDVRSSKLSNDNRNLLMSTENVAGSSTSSPDENALLHISDISNITLSALGVREEDLELLGDIIFDDIGAEIAMKTYTSLSRSTVITEAEICCASSTPGDGNCKKNPITLDHHKTVQPLNVSSPEIPFNPQGKDNVEAQQLDSHSVPSTPIQTSAESECLLGVTSSEQIPRAVSSGNDQAQDGGQHSPGTIASTQQNVHNYNDCSEENSTPVTLDHHNTVQPPNGSSPEIPLNRQAKDNVEAKQLDSHTVNSTPIQTSTGSECLLGVPSSKQIPQVVSSGDDKNGARGLHLSETNVLTPGEIRHTDDRFEEIAPGIAALITPPISPNSNDEKKSQLNSLGGFSREPVLPPVPLVHCHQHPEFTINLEELEFVKKKTRGRPSKGRTTAMGRPKPTRKVTKTTEKSLKDEPTQCKRVVSFSEKSLEEKLSQILDGIISSETLPDLLNGDYQIEKKLIEQITTVTLNDAICSDNLSITCYGKYFKRGALVALRHLIDEKKKHGPWKCGICKNELTAKSIECDCCLKWIDWKCSCLKEVPKGSWFCSSCLNL